MLTSVPGKSIFADFICVIGDKAPEGFDGLLVLSSETGHVGWLIDSLVRDVVSLKLLGFLYSKQMGGFIRYHL